MLQSRKDWLEAQYIDAIENDGKWYSRLRDAAVSDENFAKFRRHCGSAIIDLKNALGAAGMDDSFGEKDRTYVVLELWKRNGGNMRNTSDEFKFYEGRAETFGIYETTNQENDTMNPESAPKSDASLGTRTAFETITKHYVFGTNVDDMNEAQLIEAIKRVEKEIEDLKTVKTTSKKIAAKIAELEAMLVKIVETLDAK